MEYYRRQVEKSLIELHKKSRGRIVVITGARQVGKSTLAAMAFNDYPVIDMDSPVERNLYSQMTPNDWLEQYPEVIVDEVQKLPELFDTIKACYDRNDKVRFILLGSSQLLLQKRVSETLAGRAAIRELFPFTIPELMGSKDLLKQSSLVRLLLEEKVSNTLPELMSKSSVLSPEFSKAKKAWNYYICWGGMPRLLESDWTDEDRYGWLNDYYKTFLQRDLSDIARLENLQPFIKAQKSAALLAAQTVNFSNLARDADIAPPTAKKFIQYLEISYQVILLSPWHRNHGKRLTKMPKLHFIDPGVRRSILQKRGDPDGAEFESAVVSEIYKQCKNAALPVQLYHLRTSDRREVDLLIEREDGYIAIECKMGEHAAGRDARHFKSLDEILDKPLLLSLVVSNDHNVRKLKDDPAVWNVPAPLLLS
ncbi:MAG: ATP-binding protein [Planctomycetota bacterium]|jgi:predicted AAA+ superfamily ATPase